MPAPTFTQDPEKPILTVERSFASPRTAVWKAWTTSELLDKWWAPKPWIAVTKTFEFRPGGHWHYYMQSPEGEKHWCWVGYGEIEPEQRFTAEDAFCDEEGNLSTDMPNAHWDIAFSEIEGETHVTVTITYASAEDMEKIVAMGFKEGFTMGLDNLETLLAG